MSHKEIYEIGEIPPLGHVPKYMYGQLIRADRFGSRSSAFKVEKIAVPELKPDEVLVYRHGRRHQLQQRVGGAGIAGRTSLRRGRKPTTTRLRLPHRRQRRCRASSTRPAPTGRNVKVGDRVVIHCGIWDQDCPAVRNGEDPMFDPSFKIWGYETNWGSFAQFTKVQAHQCMPKAPHLTWEEAAAPTLVGATAYRMLMGWPPHTVRKDDVVLIWGASGGLGCMATQIVKAEGGIPVGVVGDDRKIDFCKKLGAKGCINRKKFRHWGMMPHWKDNDAFNEVDGGCRAFGKALWDDPGRAQKPAPGLRTSRRRHDADLGLRVRHGRHGRHLRGHTGYNAVVDLRYLWMRQKRFRDRISPTMSSRTRSINWCSTARSIRASATLSVSTRSGIATS